MFIVRPDVEEADLDKLIEGFSATSPPAAAKSRAWRRWAAAGSPTRSASSTTAFMSCSPSHAAGSLIGEIERRLRVSEPVIKFITVRMDEEEKRLAKVKALRDSKVKRSAQPDCAAARLPPSPPPQRPSRPRAEAPAAAEPEAVPVAPSPSPQRSNRRGTIQDFALRRLPLERTTKR